MMARPRGLRASAPMRQALGADGWGGMRRVACCMVRRGQATAKRWLCPLCLTRLMHASLPVDARPLQVKFKVTTVPSSGLSTAVESDLSSTVVAGAPAAGAAPLFWLCMRPGCRPAAHGTALMLSEPAPLA